MALVNVLDVNVLDNPTSFTNPFQFEITFECLKHLPDDLEWKVIYVGSAGDGKYDQELDSILVGPIPVGVNKFVFQANAPDVTKIPKRDLLGVTVVMVTCFYKNQEFIRIGYYVNNELCDENSKELSNLKTSAAAGGADDTMVRSGGDDESMALGGERDDSPADGKEDDAEMEVEETPVMEEDSNSMQAVVLSRKADVAKIRRNILATKPRVTRYSINWEDSE
eukprot:g5541.t1